VNGRDVTPIDANNGTECSATQWCMTITAITKVRLKLKLHKIKRKLRFADSEPHVGDDQQQVRALRGRDEVVRAARRRELLQRQRTRRRGWKFSSAKLAMHADVVLLLLDAALQRATARRRRDGLRDGRRVERAAVAAAGHHHYAHA